MNNSPIDTGNDSLVPLNKVRELYSDLEHAQSEAKRWSEKATKLLVDIAAVNQALSLLGVDLASFGFKVPKEVIVEQAKSKVSGKRVTWLTEVQDAVDRLGRCDYAELKEEVRKGPLGAKIGVRDGGFYGATGKLADRHDIMRVGDIFFSKPAYEEYLKAVESGEEKEIYEDSNHRAGTMPAAILNILEGEETGLKGFEVVARLKEDEQYKELATRRINQVYNTLHRITGTGQLVKDPVEKLYRLKKYGPYRFADT